jgi:two-component system, NarL family, sensor histidine kinase BarA
MTNHLPLFDWQLAQERAGGDSQFAVTLTNLYLKDLPDYRQRIAQLYQSGDLVNLYDKLHKLYGASSYCGFVSVKEALRQAKVLMNGGENIIDSNALGSAIDQLLIEIDRLLVAARQLPDDLANFG